MSTLHITNGDSTVRTWREARLEGDYLSWIDSLIDGPVPGLPLDELRDVRAKYISAGGWDSFENVRRALGKRDQTIGRWEDHDEVILWFEHDLFDCLQLLQILDFFSPHVAELRGRLKLIQIGSFPGIERFTGLGQLTAAQLRTLLPTAQPVSSGQLQLGSDAWKAFTAPDPTTLATLAQQEHSALTYLRPCFARWLEEFPSTTNGLSRTENQLLRAAAAGMQDAREIYMASSRAEEAIFMGDSSAFALLDRLSEGKTPALTKSSRWKYEITAFGDRLARNEADWIDENGIDLWRGGVQLGPENVWRWNAADARLVQSS
jgi:hypothetical protein